MSATGEIRTARLLLRRARATDLDDIHAILSMPAAMRYWSVPEHETIAESRDWLDRMMARPASEADDFLIEYQGRVIGKAGAWNLPEVGFILHSEHWHKGFASEAMRAVITHLFARHDMAALTAEADPRNAASLGLLASLGFVETYRAERTLMWRDEWCDSVYLTLPRAAWVG